MKRNLITALTLCTVLLMQALPVSAAYTSDEIAFSIRPAEGTQAASDGAVHVSAEEAAKGTTLHFGMYIEADRAELNRIGARLQTDSKQLTFVQDTLITGRDQISETEISYVLPDSTTFSTTYQPYCLGEVNSNGGYLPNCFTFEANLLSDTELYLYWFYGIGNATKFLGGQSDLFSFCQFDVAIAPGTASGTYSLEFVADAAEQYPEAEHLTSLACDMGTITEPDYHRTIPTLKGIQIVVDREQPEKETKPGDVNRDGNINASDATEVLQYAAMLGNGGSVEESRQTFMLDKADLNHDGAVNAMDATGILRYSAAAGLGKTLTWEEIFA